MNSQKYSLMKKKKAKDPVFKCSSLFHVKQNKEEKEVLPAASFYGTSFHMSTWKFTAKSMQHKFREWS